MKNANVKKAMDFAQKWRHVSGSLKTATNSSAKQIAERPLSS